MKFVAYLIFIFPLCESGPIIKRTKEISDPDAEGYLNRFGYLQVIPEPRSGVDIKQYNATKAAAKKKAILMFQRFNNLPETGTLDENTKDKMLAPRCGISDLDYLKRDATNKWTKQQLQWTVKQFSGQISEGDTRRAMSEALNIWSKVVPLDFVEVNPESHDADVQIKFVTGVHDDPYPFDGTGKVLAHAFYPKDGRVHFDDDEQWSYGDREKLAQGYTDVLAVAVHELGHTLGLAHSKDRNAVMAAYYKDPPTSGLQLGDDDIKRIQRIYGARSGSGVMVNTEAPTPEPRTIAPKPPVKPLPTPKVPNDGGPSSKSCPNTVDGATSAMNSYSYFFSGNSVWRLDESGRKSPPEYIDQLFPKGPSSITAVVTNQNSQLTILFQGRQVYAFEWSSQSEQFVLQNDYPKQLTDDVQFTPTSAFRWTDGNIVLANGDDFVTYDEYWNKATFKNKISSYFSDLPSSSSSKIFNYQTNLLAFDGSKYSLYDTVSKQRKDVASLKQFLKC